MAERALALGLGLAHEPLDQDLATRGRSDRADPLARTLAGGGAGGAGVLAAPRRLVPRPVLAAVAPDRRPALGPAAEARAFVAPLAAARCTASGTAVAVTALEIALAAALRALARSTAIVVLAPLVAPRRALALRLADLRSERRDRLPHRAFEVDAGLASELRSELLLQDLGAHLLDESALEVAELERPEGEADQPVHGKAEMLEDVLDLAVLALAQAERDPDIVALHAVERRLDRSVVHALEGDRRLELVELRLRHVAMRAHPVAAHPAGVRMGDHLGEPAVIGEEQEPLGVDVEAADRDDARQILGQALEHGRPAFGIARRGDEAARLVEEPQPRALARRQRLAVDGDPVLVVTLTAGESSTCAVERDAALGDHRLGVAARRDAGAGDHLGDAVLLRRLGLRLRGGGALVAGAAAIGPAAIGPAVVPAVVGHAGLIAEPEWRGERTRTMPARRRSIRWASRSPRRAPRQHAARCRSAPSIVSDGAVVAAAGNTPPALSRIPTAHAEMLAIRAAGAALGDERLSGCDLYVTLEPCAMCAAAISFARIRRLYFGARRSEGRRGRERRALLRRPDLPPRAGGLRRHSRGGVGGTSQDVLRGAALTSSPGGRAEEKCRSISRFSSSLAGSAAARMARASKKSRTRKRSTAGRTTISGR